MTPRVLALSCDAVRKIYQNHQLIKAARQIVDALPNRAQLNPEVVTRLVKKQVSYLARDLVGCVKRANEAAGKIDKLPSRASQGKALREIRTALEGLRNAVKRNWSVVKPVIEIEATLKLEELLSTAALEKLTRPAGQSSEPPAIGGHESAYHRKNQRRSLIFRAGEKLPVRLITLAIGELRRAEVSIAPGAPRQNPLALALIIQLAQHFEGMLGKKASWTAAGPFDRFCQDVFESLGLFTASESGWEYLLRDGLKHHRASFGWRRLHEQSDAVSVEGARSEKGKRRKTPPTLSITATNTPPPKR